MERRATGSSDPGLLLRRTLAQRVTRRPCFADASDVETNISNLASLLDSYRRIQATSNDSPSLRETEGELQSTLQLLEADLADLDESVRVVEGHGDRWGIAHTEVAERRAFVNRITSEVAVRQEGDRADALAIERCSGKRFTPKRKCAIRTIS